VSVCGTPFFKFFPLVDCPCLNGIELLHVTLQCVYLCVFREIVKRELTNDISTDDRIDDSVHTVSSCAFSLVCAKNFSMLLKRTSRNTVSYMIATYHVCSWSGTFKIYFHVANIFLIF